MKLFPVVGLVVATAFLASAQQPHPRLGFSGEDLPQLRQRAEQMPGVRDTIISQAEALVGPGRIDPDTLVGIGADVRQQIRGHRIGGKLLSWVEPLGFAYQLTGDERFGREGARLLVTVGELPPDEPPVGPHAFAGARGDILRAMAVGYDWLYSAMTEEERETVAGMMARYVENILAESPDAWWMPYHNFIGVAVGACGAASLVLEDRFPERAADWRQQSIDLINLWLSSGFDKQGAYVEGVGYSFYGLTNATLFMDALQRTGGPNLFEHPHLQRYPHFLAQSLLPGERVFDARNDSGYTNGATPVLLRLSGEGYPVMKWLWVHTGGPNRRTPWIIIWANDVEPQSPEEAGEPLSALFPERGLAVFRTGWGAEDLMFSVEAGEYFPVIHDQADKGHFTFYGRGGWWAIDSGYGNNRDPEGKAQTVAHNCVLIDGRGQALTGASYGTDGAILDYSATERAGYVLADATDAYLENNRGDVGVPLQRAHRHCFFLRPAENTPAYAIVVDDIIVDEAEHEYDWLLHTGTRNEMTLHEGGCTLEAIGAASGSAYVVTPVETTGSGSARFEFAVEQAGDYHVWGCVRARGESPGKSDSFRVQMDDGPVVDWHMGGGDDWSWREVHELHAQEPTTFALEPGRHALTISTRERGAQIDAVYVTAAPDFSPAAPDGDAIYFEAEAADRIQAPMQIGHEPLGEDPRCAVRFAWPAQPRLAVDGYEDHPRLHARASMVKGRFAAALVPFTADQQPPTVSADGTTMIVGFGDVRDTLEVTYREDEPSTWRFSRAVEGEEIWSLAGPASDAG